MSPFGAKPPAGLLQQQQAQAKIAQDAADQARAAAASEALQTEAQKAADATRQKAKQASGRSNTILTSPSGVIDAGAALPRTLLGS